MILEGIEREYLDQGESKWEEVNISDVSSINDPPMSDLVDTLATVVTLTSTRQQCDPYYPRSVRTSLFLSGVCMPPCSRMIPSIPCRFMRHAAWFLV
jgi:hypothetical protein